MKKKKIQIPAHMFGLFSAIGQAGEQAGEAAGGDVGQFVSGAFNPAKAGLSYINNKDVSAGNKLLAFTGVGSVFARRQAQRAAERKAEFRANQQLANRNTDLLTADYYQDNDLAYTYANGGITPSLAYVDNGEIIRTPDGNINQVEAGNPNATDDVLAALPEGSAILSDRLKVPGTNKTFAEMGKKLEKKTKGSKGKDKYAQNADRLNQMNADAEFNNLLVQQEELKQRKGIKNKTKAFAYGGVDTHYMDYDVDDIYNNISLMQPIGVAPIAAKYAQPTPTATMPSEVTTKGLSTASLSTPNKTSNRRFNAGTLANVAGVIGSLAPTMYNAIRGSQEAEYQDAITNPYSGAALRNMSRRRFNINPILEANRRSRAVNNYNLSQINPNTGANLAARSQAAATEYSANAAVYGNMQNANNQYLGETAELLNNLGAQYVRQRNVADEINARNRAAKRNFQATAASQLGEFAQIQSRMANERSRDDMVMPFLSQFLSAGYSKDMIDQLWNKYYKR